nr:hypothetical protein [Candidatus Njordarchaeum guaymaensis]
TMNPSSRDNPHMKYRHQPNHAEKLVGRGYAIKQLSEFRNECKSGCTCPGHAYAEQGFNGI